MSDEIRAEALRITRAFIEAEELRKKAARDVTALAGKIADWYPDATQRQIAELQNYLYWDTDLPYRDWPKAINFKKSYGGTWGKVKSSAEPRVFLFACSMCEREYEHEALSRTERDKGTGLCPDCLESKDSREAERAAFWAAQAEERMAEQERLRTMPYQEYLKTEHWSSIRASALRRTGYRCATCNAKDTILDVHHRTYERRGQEYASDVIALCRACHARFHGVQS